MLCSNIILDMRAFKKIKLKAVSNDNLDAYLEALGLLKPLQSGQVKCSICGKTVAKDSFSCLYPDNGEIGIACDDASCYLKALRAKEDQS